MPPWCEHYPVRPSSGRMSPSSLRSLTMNRLLSSVRSMADKIVELSRGLVKPRTYGNSKALSDVDRDRLGS